MISKYFLYEKKNRGENLLKDPKFKAFFSIIDHFIRILVNISLARSICWYGQEKVDVDHSSGADRIKEYIRPNGRG